MLVISCAYLLCVEAIEAKAWKASSHIPNDTDFPENELRDINSRPNTAIAFTGGGSRSYLASIGYLAALTELGNLFPKIVIVRLIE